MNFKKVAIVHDALCVAGGAERLTAYISKTFPEADIFTSVYNPDNTFSYFKTQKIHSFKTAKNIRTEGQLKRSFPLLFLYFRFLDLSGYDLILSSSTYLAKFLKTPLGATHVCYLHSPFRYVWKRDSYTIESLPFNKPIMKIIDKGIPVLQKWDKYYTQKIDHLLTNSLNMAQLIEAIYDRKAEVIHPPIEVSEFDSSPIREDYYLSVGRLISYKRTDLAVKACRDSNRKLIVVGVGPEREALMRLGGVDITFLGKVSDEELKDLYSKARGLIFPGDEDFGIVPLEAQASGCPVIAYKSGGALETVIENETGVFFDQQNPGDLIAALDRFEQLSISSERVRKNALRFDINVFEEKIKSYLENI